ncbi:MAG TPA: hypothetical protein RMH99_23905 [Sandaracinaceae bacterium LLY-WYZ-13_1]|nr:hypothetical protein [Sandaracinaceae bacterium LLY-WYZ-13_1]
MRRPIVPLLLIALSSLAMSGCKVTQEDIDYWTGTRKGPGKIVAVLLADKYETDLRVYAGVALVRMQPRPGSTETEPVDGVQELQAALERIQDAEERTRIVDGMAPHLIEMMRGEDAPAAGDGDQVQPRQMRAKDAAFSIIPYASDEQRQALTDAVVDWFVVDFNGRNLAGNYSAEQVVRELGAPAASRLVNALNAQLPQQALVKLAELIATLGNDETKQRAAERLVEIEEEMEGEEFFGWLQERLREQLRERQGEDAEIDENRVRAAAMLNRENFINLGALPAMKHLNEEEAVQDRLLEMAQRTEAENVTPRQMEARRTKALQALEGGVREDMVEPLLNLALNDDNPLGVRDYAFDRVADSRSTAALTRLWPAFSDAEDSDWRIRWRVGSLILTLGGSDVVQRFFNSLDDGEYAHEELYGYGERLSNMRPPPTDFVNAQLSSDDWYDRAIALFFWEKRATADDVSRITALSEDDAETQGPHWEEEQATIGGVAEAVARAVRERLGEDDEESDASGGDGGDGADE